MTKIQAIKDSIAHHKRMLEWAKKQKPTENADFTVMLRILGGNWYGEHCALCTKYYNLEIWDYCGKCPLNKSDLGCMTTGSPWAGLARSKTWGEFVENEERMINALKGLLKEEL